MDNDEIRPSRWLYVLAALVFVGGWVGFAVILFMNLWGMEGKLQQVVVPGRTEITLRDAGTYTIFYEHKSVVGNKVYSTAQELSGLECAVISKATGAKVPLSVASMSGNYEFGGRAGTSVFDFNIHDPGVYELSAAYPEGQAGPEVVLAVGHDFTMGLLTTIFGSLAIVFGSMLVSIVIVVVTAVKRSNSKKRLNAGPGTHPHSPGATS
jgi:2',3'-cyclic-nucleotide 2'-phosphodiesterase (5'-nucleotidase family)